LLIVVLGLALRLWGIGWSLPDARHPLATYHPDELINLNAARAADIPHLQFDIQFYSYGALDFYLVSFAQTFAQGWGLITQAPAQNPTPAQIASEQAGLFLTGRIVTALLGTATIWVVFALGCRCCGRRAGLMAALLYALAPLAVVHAHFLTVDVPATFFVALALLWAVRLLTEPTWKTYVLAGIWCGLAAATKYTAGFVLIAPIVAHFLNLAPGTCRKHRIAQGVVLLAVAALAFLIGCPGPILNWDAFWNGTYPGSGVYYEIFQHARTGHGDLFIDTGPGWWYHLVISLRYGLGLPLLLLALTGLIAACLRRTRQDWVLLSFFLLYYILTGFSAVRFARYMLPLFPVLCVWAGCFVSTPENRAEAETPDRKKNKQALQAAGALVALLTGVCSVSLVHLMTLRDPQDAAADYLEKTAPQGASIAFAKVPWFFSPPLSPLFGAPAAPTRAKAAQQTTRFQLRIPSAEWDTRVLTPPPNYVVLSDLETLNAVARLHQSTAVRFVQAIPADYRRNVFAPPAPVFGLFRSGPAFPEDLLYIMPTLTVYQQPLKP
jgi:4-amino-4-deoxy-L-arabinose transferase-like glycosyltransferase